MTSLHPYYKVGDQIAEAVRVHQQVSKQEAHEQAVEMLRRVGIPVRTNGPTSTRTSSPAACVSGR